MKQPAFQMYTGDWLSDPALSRCEEATRGIWVDVICNMKREGATGYLAGTLAQLARMCRTIPERMRAALSDLRNTGTADVLEDGEVFTLVNRRMVREREDLDKSNDRVKRYRTRNACETPLKRPSSSSSSSSSSTSESTNVDSSFSPTPPSPAPEETRAAPAGDPPHPVSPPDPPNLPWWNNLLFAAKQAGMSYAEGELKRIRDRFGQLDEAERRGAITGIEVRMQIGQYSDPAFIPRLRNYVFDKRWTEELRPRPQPKPPQQQHMDFGEMRRQRAREEFRERMMREVNLGGLQIQSA